MGGVVIEIVGWLAVGGWGAYTLFCFVFVLTTIRGGLEKIPLGLTFGTIAVIIWIAGIFWLSPLTIGVAP